MADIAALLRAPLTLTNLHAAFLQQLHTHPHIPTLTPPPASQDDQGMLPYAIFEVRKLNVCQIWSMKKNEDQAAKKKPKTSAAQIRVQKGTQTVTPK